jgi:uncharacterized protein DUF4190/putative regulator of septum formation
MTDQSGWAAPSQQPRQEAPPASPSHPPSAPPPQVWSSYPPSAPPANRAWNGLAIAALVVGILPGAVIAIGLGTAALVQIGNRGGRGKAMAIVGVVLGSLWTVFIALAIVGAAVENESDGNQTPTPPGAAQRQATALKAGDCTADFPETGLVGNVPVVPCGTPHRDEVFAVVTIPGSKYPSDTEMAKQASYLCETKLDAVVGDKPLPADTQMFYLGPTRFAWATGDHSLRCLVEFSTDHTGRLLPG